MPGDSPAAPTRLRAAIKAYDMERSLHFYRDLLGLKVVRQWDHDGGGVLLDAGSGLVELVGKPPEILKRGGWDFIPPIAKFEVVLEVDDVDGWHAALCARGLEPESEPRDTAWGGRSFTVLDPDETPVKFLTLKSV